MKSQIFEASIPNPRLSCFEPFIGEWETTGAHPLVPNTALRGQASVKWIEGGAFLLMQTTIFDERFPAGIALFGSDDALDQLFMLYFDERTVSRKYDVSIKGDILHWWRNAPGFSQRYIYTFSDDHNTIIGKGELSEDDVHWKPDLDLVFRRIR